MPVYMNENNLLLIIAILCVLLFLVVITGILHSAVRKRKKSSSKKAGKRTGRAGSPGEIAGKKEEAVTKDLVVIYSWKQEKPGRICPGCEAENPKRQKFCRACGMRL